MSEIKVTIEELQKYKIFVGTPMYGGQCAGSYTKASTDLAMMCAANGIGINFYYLFNESLIQRARNYVVDEFLRSDCTHLLFIDADIAFNPRDVLGLLAVQISDPEKYNIVTGPYPKKTIAWEKVARAAAAGLGKDNPFELENYGADYVFNPVKKGSSFNLSEPLEIVLTGVDNSHTSVRADTLLVESSSSVIEACNQRSGVGSVRAVGSSTLRICSFSLNVV